MAPEETLAAASDDDLLPRIAAGDAEALTALYWRRRADVYRFALHMTASRSVADDVTQEVFLTVMQDARRFQPERASVAAWLCGIARNHVRRRLDRDRLLQPLAVHAGDGAVDDPALVSHADPLGDLTRGERLEKLRRAVLSLPLRYREVVILCDLQELSYAHAAEALDCAVGTVRSRLHRGRALLAAKMATGEAPADDVKPGNARCFA